MIDLRSCQLIVEFCLPGKWQRRWNSPSNKPKSTSNRRRRNEPFWWSPKCQWRTLMWERAIWLQFIVHHSCMSLYTIVIRQQDTYSKCQYCKSPCTCFHTNGRLISELNGDEYTSQRLKCNWRQVTVWIDGCYKDYSDVLCVLVYYWTFQLKVSYWTFQLKSVDLFCFTRFIVSVILLLLRRQRTYI